MKKKIFPVLLVIMVLTAALLLSACGSDQPNNIEGSYESGGTVYTFAEDGTMSLEKDGQISYGWFTADNGHLTITIDGKETKYDYTYESSILSLFSPGSLFGTQYTKVADAQAVIDGWAGMDLPTEPETEPETEESSTAEPAQAETSTAETTSAETTTAQTSPSETTQEPSTKAAEPATSAEPAPGSAEPAPGSAEPEVPAGTEPAATEPAAEPATEPAAPAATEPAQTEPAQNEPAQTEPANQETPPAETAPSKSVPEEPQSKIVGDVYPGALVTFGHYEQDNDLSNGAEAIEWYVLKVDGNRAFLMSAYGLDSKPYDYNWGNSTWNTSTLRYWLNDTFYNTAFSAEEQAIINTTAVTADANGDYSTYAGETCEDKVFLLSTNQAYIYFSNYWDRVCSPTAYATAQGATYDYAEGGYWWWLRTPGRSSNYAALIAPSGTIDYVGYYTGEATNLVRPVMWVTIG